MNISIRYTMTALIVALCTALPAHAAERKPEFGVDAGVGYQFDSNVNIAELDTSTGEADNALLLELGLDGNIPLTDKLSLKLGYGYSQTTYQDFSEFDLGLHRGHAEVGYRVGGFDTAVALRRFAVLLDNERFLDIRQVSPSVSRLIGNTLYLRGAYTNAEKTYTDNPARDAVNDAVEADAYILLNGMQRYLAFGFRVDTEDAVNGELDYDGTRAKATYGHRLEWLPLDVDLKAKLQMENRDYVNVTEAIGAPRRDKRFRAGLSAAVPLSQRFRLEGEAEYADNASNLDTAAYDETVFSVNLAAEF